MKYLTPILITCIAALPVLTAQAAPDVKSVRSKLRGALKSQTQFERAYAKLSATQKAALLDSLATLNLDDSDSDGLPDPLEGGERSNLCDSDSDKDGKSDGSEIEDEQRPDDSDSNDDGRPDGEEAKSKGTISAIPSTTEFVVGGKTWVIADSTRFKDGLTSTSLSVGLCVEVEGVSATGGKFTAVSVSREDRC